MKIISRFVGAALCGRPVLEWSGSKQGNHIGLPLREIVTGIALLFVVWGATVLMFGCWELAGGR